MNDTHLTILPRLRDAKRYRSAIGTHLFLARVGSLWPSALRGLMRGCAIRVGHLCTPPDNVARIVVAGRHISENEYLLLARNQGGVPRSPGDGYYAHYARRTWEIALEAVQNRWSHKWSISMATSACVSAQDALRKVGEDEHDIDDLVDLVYESQIRAGYWYGGS